METMDTCYCMLLCRKFHLQIIFILGDFEGKQSQKSPRWIEVRWKLLIIQFLLVPPRLSYKFNSALPLNYISERCFGAIFFPLANSNIWSVTKLQAIINLSSWKFVESQLFTKCKTHVFLKKNRQDFTDIVYIFMAALNYQFCYLFHPFQLPKLPRDKIFCPQTIRIRRIIINQIASSIFYKYILEISLYICVQKSSELIVQRVFELFASEVFNFLKKQALF